jgi:hypothetical protein
MIRLSSQTKDPLLRTKKLQSRSPGLAQLIGRVAEGLARPSSSKVPHVWLSLRPGRIDAGRPQEPGPIGTLKSEFPSEPLRGYMHKNRDINLVLFFYHIS